MATPHDPNNIYGQQFADQTGQFTQAGPPPGYFEPPKPKRNILLIVKMATRISSTARSPARWTTEPEPSSPGRC
jgi:hypothetical protein